MKPFMAKYITKLVHLQHGFLKSPAWSIKILTSDNSFKAQACMVLSEMSGSLLYLVIKTIPTRRLALGESSWNQGEH